ncbi:cAMP-responsive element modulator-like isoform X2 [Lineus longissimus]|uniref:cAMP-responsive element modulator-like isoform X2 n=1 Tax=Lineus longissimus TaxID=88925 RepID=UPI00315CA48E
MELNQVQDSGETTQQTRELADSPTPALSIVHVSIPNQAIQVQSVIQGQPSVIQTASGQTLQAIQLATLPNSESDQDQEDNPSKKRREALTRRPSYRKILNELSSDPPGIPLTKVEEEESNGSQENTEVSEAANTITISQGPGGGFQQATVIPAQTIQIASHSDAATQGLQTLTMTNANNATQATQGATIVQYAQGPDGQFFIPGEFLAGTNVQAYQISTPTTLPQGVVMATSGTTLGGSPGVGEEASRKRELRLLKNREAARECRRKKKDYVKCLENRVAVLENQNKALIEELKSLKELYCQKEAAVQ